MKKRIIGFLLAAFLLVSLIPAYGEPKAAAADFESVSWTDVSSWAGLATALEQSNTKYLRLAGDIEERIDPRSSSTVDKPFEDCTVNVRGTKILDLNGFSIHFDDCQNVDRDGRYTRGNGCQSRLLSLDDETEVLFDVMPDADFTVIDSDGDGKIHFDGYYVGTGAYTNRDYYEKGLAVYQMFNVQGSLTINGGTFEAGGSKKQYLTCNISGGLDGYAYQELAGIAVKVSGGGTFIANGGSLEGHVEECVEVFEGGTCRINDGIFTGCSGADVFFNNKGSLTVLAGSFRTRKHDYIRGTDQKPAGGSIVYQTRDTGSYGCIGIPASAFCSNTIIKQNNRSDYAANASGDTTVTPKDYDSGSVVSASGGSKLNYKIATSSIVSFTDFSCYFPEDSLLMNPKETGKLAKEKEYCQRNGIARYLWQLYKKTAVSGNTVWEPVLDSEYITYLPEIDLKELYGSWEDGRTYAVGVKAVEYWSGRSNSYTVNISASNRLTVNAYYSFDTISYVDIVMSPTGLQADTHLSDYDFSSDTEGVKQIIKEKWYSSTSNGEPVAYNALVDGETKYQVELYIKAAEGYKFSAGTKIGINGEYYYIDSSYGGYSAVTWTSELMAPVIPAETYVEGELLTEENPVHTCSGGGTATWDAYSNTLTLDRAVIHSAADLSGAAAPDPMDYDGILIRQPDAYDEYDYENTLVTLVLKGENTVAVDRKAVELQNGRTMTYGEGIESQFALKIIQGDENGSLEFTGSALDSIHVWNCYDDPFDYKDDNDEIALFLEAPVVDLIEGISLDDAGNLYAGGAGSFRGRMVNARGMKLEEGFRFYAAWKDSVPIEERKAESRYKAEQYRMQDAYTYMEIGRDYGVTVQTEGWDPIYVNSANADDVLHDGGSVTYSAQGLPALTLTDAQLYGGSDPAVNVECHYLNLNLYGDNTILMDGDKKGNGYSAVSNDYVTNLGGAGNLTIRASEAGTVYGTGIMSNSLKINMSGSLVIRDAISGILTSGIQTMSGGQSYMEYLDYYSGMVTVYAPEMPEDSDYHYRNYAISHAPEMAGGSWAGEWELRVGNEDSLSAARAFSSGDNIRNYRYCKLWRSGINTVSLKLFFHIPDNTDRSYAFYQNQKSKSFFPESEIIYNTSGTPVDALEADERYCLTASFPMEDSLLDSNFELLSFYDYLLKRYVTVPVIDAGSAASYSGDCIYVKDGKLNLVYNFTNYSFAVTASVRVGIDTDQIVYDVGEVEVVRKNQTIVYKGEVTDKGAVVNVPGLEPGDVLTLKIPGYVPCMESGDSKTYENGNQTWHVQFYLLGDTVLDGTLDLKDVSWLFRYWNGKYSANTVTNQRIRTSDFDGNGIIDLRDAAALYRFVTEESE